MPNPHIIIQIVLLLGVVLNTYLWVWPKVDINDKITTPEPIPYKYLGASQNNSITLQNGKMYRIYDHIVPAREVPRTLFDHMARDGFHPDGITVTQVGVVQWMDKGVDAVDGTVTDHILSPQSNPEPEPSKYWHGRSPDPYDGEKGE